MGQDFVLSHQSLNYREIGKTRSPDYTDYHESTKKKLATDVVASPFRAWQSPIEIPRFTRNGV